MNNMKWSFQVLISFLPVVVHRSYHKTRSTYNERRSEISLSLSLSLTLNKQKRIILKLSLEREKREELQVSG